MQAFLIHSVRWSCSWVLALIAVNPWPRCDARVVGGTLATAYAQTAFPDSTVITSRSRSQMGWMRRIHHHHPAGWSGVQFLACRWMQRSHHHHSAGWSRSQILARLGENQVKSMWKSRSDQLARRSKGQIKGSAPLRGKSRL